jgi:hypothetical protein
MSCRQKVLPTKQATLFSSAVSVTVNSLISFTSYRSIPGEMTDLDRSVLHSSDRQNVKLQQRPLTFLQLNQEFRR